MLPAGSESLLLQRTLQHPICCERLQMPQRSEYWSNSAFARWMLRTFAGGTVPKPDAATLKEWKEWRKTVIPKPISKPSSSALYKIRIILGSSGGNALHSFGIHPVKSEPGINNISMMKVVAVFCLLCRSKQDHACLADKPRQEDAGRNRKDPGQNYVSAYPPSYRGQPF